MSVYVEMSMSLDGFVAGSDVSPAQPMGEGGERLHEWMFADRTAEEATAFQEAKFAEVGAVIMGHTTFELGVEPWGDDPTFHAPCFVISSTAHDVVARDSGTSYTFVTEGPDRALADAKEAAGDADVMVMGGARTAQQFIQAEMLDELRIHLVPVVLGAGLGLFDSVGAAAPELTVASATTEHNVIHLRFELSGRPSGQ
jgi:dihydrofolate reductase